MAPDGWARHGGATVTSTITLPRAQWDAASLALHEFGMLVLNATEDETGRVYILSGELARGRQLMAAYYKAEKAGRVRDKGEQLLLELAA